MAPFWAYFFFPGAQKEPRRSEANFSGMALFWSIFLFETVQAGNLDTEREQLSLSNGIVPVQSRLLRKQKQRVAVHLVTWPQLLDSA